MQVSEQEVEGRRRQGDGVLVRVEGGDSGVAADIRGALHGRQLPDKRGKLRIAQKRRLEKVKENTHVSFPE